MQRSLKETHRNLNSIIHPVLEPEKKSLKAKLHKLERRVSIEQRLRVQTSFSFFKKKPACHKLIHNIQELNDYLHQLLTKQGELETSDRQHREAQATFFATLDGFIQKFDHFIQLYGFLVFYSTKDKLPLGVSSSGEILNITATERLEHLYTVGSTGSGKSMLISNLILSDIFNGNGGYLLCPMGGLFRDVVAFCLYYTEIRGQFKKLQTEIKTFLEENDANLTDFDLTRFQEADKLSVAREIAAADIETIFPELNVKFIDLSSSENPWRINPFQPEKEESLQECVDTLLTAIERHTDTTSEATPRFRLVFKSLISYAIAEKKSLSDLQGILTTFSLHAGQGTNKAIPLDETFFQKKMGESNSRTAAFAQWYLQNFLLRIPPNEFLKYIESTINRISYLLDNQICANLLDTPCSTLDLTAEINTPDTGKGRSFLLFHIPTNQDGGSFLGSYLLSKIDKIIYRRTYAESQRPFYGYLDEFHKFIDENLADRFSGVRQKGYGLTVAHQNVEQLLDKTKQGKYIFNTVFQNSATKIIMKTGGEGVDRIISDCFQVQGNLQKITYSLSSGESTAIGYNLNQTTNASQTRSTTTSESTGDNWSSTVGSTVAEGVANAVSRNQSQTAGRTTPQRTLGFYTGMKNPNSILAYSDSSGSSHSSGTSQTQNRSESNSNTQSQGSSNSIGKSESDGISEGWAKGVGFSQNSGKTSSKTINLQYFSLEEERIFLSQGIKALHKREFFLCLPRLTTHKCVTLDAITVKLARKTTYLTGDHFSPALLKYQQQEKAKLLAAKPSDDPDSENASKPSDLPESPLFGI